MVSNSPYNFPQILETILLDNILFLDKCVQWNFIKSQADCPSCHTIMVIKFSYKYQDGGYFRCKNIKCRKRLSLKFDTCFTTSKLTLKEIIYIFGLWIIDLSIHKAALMTNFSEKSISFHYSIFQTKCIQILESGFEEEKLGGYNHYVQVDESAYGKAKYNRGRNLKYSPIWFFGMVDSETGKCYICEVPNRTGETLKCLIFKYVTVFSTIISDEWRGYNKIPLGIYRHLTVNHSKNFVNPVNGANTQKIESYWSHLKFFLKNRHTRDAGDYNDYVREWCFRKNCNFEFQKIWEKMTK